MKNYFYNFIALSSLQKSILLAFLIFIMYSLLLPESILVGLPIFFPAIIFYQSTKLFKDTEINKLIYSLLPQILFFIYFYVDSIHFNMNLKGSMAPYALKASLASLVIGIMFYLIKCTKILKNNFTKLLALLTIVSIIFFMSPILFWIGGLLILPAIVLFHSSKFFKGTISSKILLSLLPWAGWLIVLYFIEGDKMIIIGIYMVMVSLIIGYFTVLINNNNKVYKETTKHRSE